MERRIVVVTGTSSGLGREITNRLIEDGFRVVGIARRVVTPESLKVKKEDYVHFVYDFSSSDGIAKLASGIIKEVGKPFGLVNNAAIGTDGILPTMHNADIEQLVQVNVLSPFIFTKYLVRPMLAAKEGRIVNISSIVSQTGYRGLSVYAGTKAALEGFTRSLARDVGPKNVTVNCVAPGFLETAMTIGLGAQSLEKIKGRSPMKRFPSAQEVASTVSFLLSADGSGVTGTTFTVDAGNSA
jgi:3-oxoacyl-[acyl-carrier protein] reductase